MPAPEWYAADSDDADRFPEWTLRVDGGPLLKAWAKAEDNVRDFPCCDTPTRPSNRDNARAAGFDTTAEWITDLCTKLAAAEAEVARLTPKPGCRVCGRTDCATT